MISGSVKTDEQQFHIGEVAILDAADTITANAGSRFLLLGGEAWPEHPYIDWNFVTFDKVVLAQAKADWRNGRFPLIPGDSEEAIPLPE